MWSAPPLGDNVVVKHVYQFAKFLPVEYDAVEIIEEYI